MTIRSSALSLFSPLSLLAGTCSLGADSPTLAQGCFTVSGQTESISIDLGGGKSSEVEVLYYEDLADGEDEIACQAWVAVPLSAFPTWRLATRPSDVAPAIRDLASRWGARECVVVVRLLNDTGEDVAKRDECVAGRFRFEGRDWWASSSEGPCEHDL
jgi:hypothetical protein